VPFAYQRHPLAYEFAREKAAEVAGLHPKQITLVGSARIGYSLAPLKFGRPFTSDSSDIDLVAISAELFELLVQERGVFMDYWKSGKIGPRHDTQRKYWEENEVVDARNINKGFLDASHIPTYDEFPIAQSLGEAAYKFHENLRRAVGETIGRRAAFRVYRDWDAATRQITLSLRRNLAERGVVVGAEAAAGRQA
jgi:hypothetical protein